MTPSRLQELREIAETGTRNSEAEQIKLLCAAKQGMRYKKALEIIEFNTRDPKRSIYKPQINDIACEALKESE